MNGGNAHVAAQVSGFLICSTRYRPGIRLVAIEELKLSEVLVFRFSWKWRKRSPIKILERKA